MLPDTNPTPALAASPRHTLTAESQNRVVALRKVNILAAAPTDRHAGDASRMAGIIEQPVFGRGFLQLWFVPEARISLALACPRINRRRPPRGMGTGDLACPAVCAGTLETGPEFQRGL
jgi:hypothetical protein